MKTASAISLVCLLSSVCQAQTNLFPLYSSGTYSGGSGDFTNISNAQLKLQAAADYIRVLHLSANSGVSTVYNYETGKNIYWGEDGDGGNYLFRGRNVGIGTNIPVTNARLDIQGGGLNIGGAGALDATLHIKSSYGSLDRLTQIHPATFNKPALNLMGSRDASGNYNWWSWGVLASGVWACQPSTSFSGSSGLFVDRSGSVGMGTNSPGSPPFSFKQPGRSVTSVAYYRE